MNGPVTEVAISVGDDLRERSAGLEGNVDRHTETSAMGAESLGGRGGIGCWLHSYQHLGN